MFYEVQLIRRRKVRICAAGAKAAIRLRLYSVMRSRPAAGGRAAIDLLTGDESLRRLRIWQSRGAVSPRRPASFRRLRPDSLSSIRRYSSARLKSSCTLGARLGLIPADPGFGRWGRLNRTRKVLSIASFGENFSTEPKGPRWVDELSTTGAPFFLGLQTPS